MLYIPCINVLILIFWSLNCICLKVPSREYHNVFGRIFPKVLFPVLVVFAGSFFSADLEYVLTVAGVYVVPIIAGRILIDYQAQELGIN